MSLDRDTNRRQALQARAKQQKKKRLNPAFPYKPTPFDPFYFGVQNDPPKAKE